jgi:hypothetical protein
MIQLCCYLSAAGMILQLVVTSALSKTNIKIIMHARNTMLVEYQRRGVKQNTSQMEKNH